MKVGYLVNTYPSPSHSFIRREIQALERRGVPVHRFALRPDVKPLVDAGDRDESARTEHVLAHPGAMTAALALRAATRPRALLAAIGLALRVARRSERGLLHHIVYVAEAAYLAERCRALAIGHLHAHFGTNSATVAMLAATMGGPGFSFTVHGPEEFDRPEALALGEKAARATLTVAVSSFGRSQLCRWAPLAAWDRIGVVHCGIEPWRFPEAVPLPDGPPHLVSIGRLAEQKGQLMLVDAFAQAAALRPDLTLALVGDGPMRAEVEARIAGHRLDGRVTITGWVDEARVRAELARARALVMPSFAEGLPMVIMEAMAAGRPVVSTFVAGIPELVLPETGWLVPAGDVGALAGAIVRVADAAPEMLAAMGRAGRARVLERHDIDRSAAQLAGHFAASLARADGVGAAQAVSGQSASPQLQLTRGGSDRCI